MSACSLPTRAEVEQLLVEHGASPAAQAWDAPELLAAAARAAAAGSSGTEAAGASAAAAAGSCSLGGGGVGVQEGTCSNPASAAEAGTATTTIPVAATPESAAIGSCAASSSAATPQHHQPQLYQHDGADEAADGACPLLFGARLNSMKSRRDKLLANYANYLPAARSSEDGAAAGSQSAASGDAGQDGSAAAAARRERLLEQLKDNGPLGWVARQGLVRAADGWSGGQQQQQPAGGAGGGAWGGAGGLDVVYFNYPEHLKGLTLQQVRGVRSHMGSRHFGGRSRSTAAVCWL